MLHPDRRRKNRNELERYERMTIKKCDSCGSEEGVCSVLISNSFITVFGDTDDGNTWEEKRRERREYDLCDKCCDKIAAMIRCHRVK